MPSFPGDSLYQYILHNIHYPKLALDSSLEGMVKVRFVVNEDGSLSDIKIVQSIGYGCDEEVIRMVQHMPFWNPGIIDSMPAKVFFTLPVNFRLH